jgi:peptidoglycan-N-acetylglucosamine deacetylase
MKAKLKLTIVFVALSALISPLNAQTNSGPIYSNIPIEMLFPGGKSKALILSFDDGNVADKHLVKLMNDYGVVGTFHLNSNKLGTKDYLTKEEIKTIYKGHEVSGHTANHPNLTALSKIDVLYEVLEDRKELERIMGYPVRGMAYPFGNTNELVIDAITGLGIEYARTVGDSYNFSIPADFLIWQPTIHLFGKTNYIPNDTANDRRELTHFYQLINDFINTKELALLDVWGHSWEMENNQSKWDETEKCFKLLGNNPAIYYATQIDIVDYINAFRNLKFSVERNIVYNPGSIIVFFRKNGKVYCIPSGATIYLVN